MAQNLRVAIGRAPAPTWCGLAIGSEYDNRPPKQADTQPFVRATPMEVATLAAILSSGRKGDPASRVNDAISLLCTAAAQLRTVNHHLLGHLHRNMTEQQACAMARVKPKTLWKHLLPLSPKARQWRKFPTLPNIPWVLVAGVRDSIKRGLTARAKKGAKKQRESLDKAGKDFWASSRE